MKTSVSSRIARSLKLGAKKRGGAFGAGSLADIQKPKSQDWRDHFKCTPNKRHQHKWLFGTDNAVCSVCGFTCQKIKTHLYE